MAIDQLALYNNALLIIGQRRLKNITEDREPRHLLDDAYDLGAIEYCLEVVKPVFARKTKVISSTTTSSEHDLDNVYTLPSDYQSVVGVYSDSKLDQEVSRYIIEGNTLSCEYQTIHLRYISNDYVTAFTNWSQAFTRVVSAFLAREISVKLAPNRTEEIDAKLLDRIDVAKGLDKDIEPEVRSSATTNTLTNDWRLIFNDALLIMGLDEITANTGDSNRRTKLDRALDAGIVSEMLEMTGWTFAVTTTKSQYDPSVEPAWGYTRAHEKPAKMHRIDGLFHDEYLRQPLKMYQDEGDFFYTDEDEFYLQYISADFLTNPANWPTFFRRLVASKLAHDTSPSLRKEGADVDNSIRVYEDRESKAKANDAMSAPPRKLAGGNWANSRFKGGYRGRP